jgi:hypothetical protein
MELAGEYGDGLVFAIPPRGVPPAEALAHARSGAARAGRRLESFHTAALTNVVLLDPGEPADSERVIRTVGPNVMASVYYFYDAVHERGIEAPPFLRRIWARYCALVEEIALRQRGPRPWLYDEGRRRVPRRPLCDGGPRGAARRSRRPFLGRVGL